MDVSLLDTTNNLGKYNPNYKNIYKSISAHKFSEVNSWVPSATVSPYWSNLHLWKEIPKEKIMKNLISKLINL